MKFFIRKTDDMKVKFVNSDITDGCEKINSIMANNYFTGNNCETFLNFDEGRAELFVGVGKAEEKTLDSLKEAGLKAGQYLNKIKVKKISVKLRSKTGIDQKEQALAIAEGLLNANYSFDRYKKEKFEPSLEEVSFMPGMTGDLTEADLNELLAKWEGIVTCRDLVNRTANDIIPETLAAEALKLNELGVNVKVYERDDIEKFEMKAYLEVAKGSTNLPRLIVMEYLKGEGDPIVLVGKGLTYDAGGYSLKPSDGMKTMKSDMGGGATVIGAIKAAALMGLKKNVVGIVAACENMVDGNAYKPGDVIESRRGITIEVDNTDAEGRLTLADAVAFGEDMYKPRLIIDIATLTGACLVAVGLHASGMLGRKRETIETILSYAKAEGEHSWLLPFGKEYAELNKSDIAEIKNRGGHWAGASSAGEFVGAFIKDTPWVHIDIAGPAFNSAPYKYEPQGATGHMVKTLYRVIKEY